MGEFWHEQKRPDTDTHDMFACMCVPLSVNFSVLVHLDYDCHASVFSSDLKVQCVIF